jgi:hypothetical protein
MQKGTQHHTTYNTAYDTNVILLLYYCYKALINALVACAAAVSQWTLTVLTCSDIAMAQLSSVLACVSSVTHACIIDAVLLLTTAITVQHTGWP